MSKVDGCLVTTGIGGGSKLGICIFDGGILGNSLQRNVRVRFYGSRFGELHTVVLLTRSEQRTLLRNQ